MMISDKLILAYHNIAGLEYDIYGLIKAFCPEYTVKTQQTVRQDSFAYGGAKDVWEIYLLDENLKISCFERMEGVPKRFEKSFCFSYDPNIRISKKNLLKRYLYEALKEKYNKELPWGTLTGIRPVKLIAKIWQDVQNYDKSLKIIKRDYLISDEKSRLSLDIAIRQREILEQIDDNTYSLYISIPFCASICSYCSFPSGLYSRASVFIEEYMNCLCKELEVVSRAVGKEPITVYIGGGTPSVLEHPYLIRLFECLDKNFNMDKVRELTFEAGRPDSMDEELFRLLKNYPVGRLSINPQTMNDSTLKLIGRKHTGSDIVHAFELANKYGFDNVNSDLIIGLPNETERELEYSLTELLKLNIKSLTIHSLSIKKGSGLKEKADSYHYIINHNMEKLSELCTKRISACGMKAYYLYRQKDIAGNLENIGYSEEGFEGLYNILILEEKHNIIGVGAGAVTKKVFHKEDRILRLPNIKDAKLYIERFDEALNKKIHLGEKV